MRVQDGVTGGGEGDGDGEGEDEGEGEASADDERAGHALLSFRSRLLDSSQETILCGKKAS